MPKKAAEKTIDAPVETQQEPAKVVNINPLFTIADFKHLFGTLTQNEYLTLKGKIAAQVAKDSVFAMYAAGKPEPKSKPVYGSGRTLAELEAGTSAYKTGIDASLESIEKPLLAGKVCRKDLIFDLIYEPDDDPKVVAELALQLKKEAKAAQLAYLTKRNMGSGNGGSAGTLRRWKIGSAKVEYMDESWDNQFLTKAATFVTSGNVNAFGDIDRANLNYINGVLMGDPNIVNDSVDEIETDDDY